MRYPRVLKTILLLTVPGKFFSRILDQMISKSVEEQLEYEQYQFRMNRTRMKHVGIFTIRQVNEKAIERDKELYLCLINL